MSSADSCSVLVIDDDILIALDLATAFRSAGYKAVYALSASEALEAVAQQRFVAATIDNSMPGGDSGAVLIRQFRECCPDMLRVMVSSDPPADIDDIAHAHFKKPINSDFVVQHITMLLRATSCENVPR